MIAFDSPSAQTEDSLSLSGGTLVGSETSTATFLVVRAGRSRTQPMLDGNPLVPIAPAACSQKSVRASTDSLRGGECYSDDESGLILRCIRDGSGALAVEDRPMRKRRRSPGTHNGA